MVAVRHGCEYIGASKFKCHCKLTHYSDTVTPQFLKHHGAETVQVLKTFEEDFREAKGHLGRSISESLLKITTIYNDTASRKLMWSAPHLMTEWLSTIAKVEQGN